MQSIWFYTLFFGFFYRLPAGPTFHEKSSKIIGTVSRTLCIVLVIPSTSELSARSAQKNASIFLQACTVEHPVGKRREVLNTRHRAMNLI